MVNFVSYAHIGLDAASLQKVSDMFFLIRVIIILERFIFIFKVLYFCSVYLRDYKHLKKV